MWPTTRRRDCRRADLPDDRRHLPTHICDMTVAAKICGLASEASVAAAVEGGAAYLGFVFYPPSPRAVSPARAGALCAGLPPGVQRVGLFVDADDETIRTTLNAAPLDILQFHGHESPERVAEAKARFGRSVMKAIAVSAAEDVLASADYEAVADLLLFDAKPPRRPDALPGGNGLAFDWQLIAGHRWRLPWMLSGGLTAALLPEAVRISGASAVDVSSGVERRPGEKDPGKIREFLAAVRSL
jgi:phosphoribosylanthranilate isomerase